MFYKPCTGQKKLYLEGIQWEAFLTFFSVIMSPDTTYTQSQNRWQTCEAAANTLLVEERNLWKENHILINNLAKEWLFMKIIVSLITADAINVIVIGTVLCVKLNQLVTSKKMIKHLVLLLMTNHHFLFQPPRVSVGVYAAFSAAPHPPRESLHTHPRTHFGTNLTVMYCFGARKQSGLSDESHYFFTLFPLLK